MKRTVELKLKKSSARFLVFLELTSGQYLVVSALNKNIIRNDTDIPNRVIYKALFDLF